MTDSIPAHPAVTREAVTYVLSQRGPMALDEVIDLAERADIAITAKDIAGLMARGEVVTIQGLDGTELLALPSRPAGRARRQLAEMPAPVLVAVTLAVLAIAVLLVAVLNQSSAGWPAMEWPAPPD